MTEERDVVPQVRNVRVRLEAIITRYVGADQNLALVDTLMASDAGQKLNGSSAAHGYNRLVHTIYLDVLKDLWAITLDTNRDAASLTQLKRLVANENTRRALREEYARPIPVVFAGEGEPPLDARRIHAEHHRAEYGAQFDEIYPRVVTGIEDILTNGRLQALEDVRHQVVAHTRIVDTPGKGPELVQIDRFNIHWQVAETVFEEINPLLVDAALIFTGKNYGASGVRYKAQHREWAGYFWERIRSLEPAADRDVG